MDRRLISRDEQLGLSVYHEYDEQTNETRIIHIGDVDDVLEHNKVLQNDSDYSKKGIKQEFWKYASIPAGIQVKWLVEHGVDIWNKDHYAGISKLLEDPQYRHLKCTTGHHKLKG